MALLVELSRLDNVDDLICYQGSLVNISLWLRLLRGFWLRMLQVDPSCACAASVFSRSSVIATFHVDALSGGLIPPGTSPMDWPG